MIKLNCGCKISEEGKFIVSEDCSGCIECNMLTEIHPFGEKSIFDILEKFNLLELYFLITIYYLIIIIKMAI